MSVKLGPINAAIPTPVTGDGDLDQDGAKRLFDRLISLEIDGVLLLGTMGEGPWLSDSTRNTLIESAADQLGGKLTLFASVADSSRSRMLERVRRYHRFGADVNVICPTPGVSRAEAINDVLAVAEASPTPCLFYHIPAVTGHTFNLDSLRVVLNHENIVAIKDSSSNSLLAQGLTAEAYRVAGVKLFDGDEYRTAYSALLGFDGVMHGGGALTGRCVRDIWNAARSGDTTLALELDRTKSLCLAQIYNRFSEPLQNTLGQKYALQLMDAFGEAAVVRSDQQLNADDRKRIESTVAANRSWLDAVGLPTTKASGQ